MNKSSYGNTVVTDGTIIIIQTIQQIWIFKKYYGDSLCDSAHYDKNNYDHKACSYNTTSLNPCMYAHCETCIDTSGNTGQETRNDLDDTPPDLDHAIRDCIEGERTSKTMLDVQVLHINDDKNSLLSKLMDRGANRGLTKFAHLLHGYRRIKKIPVNGIGENGAACYIIGVGYMNLETTDGSYITCNMYHAPT